MARPDFRAAAARRLSEDRELSPAIFSLLSSDDDVGRSDRRARHPGRARSSRTRTSRGWSSTRTRSHELAASIREHGVLQPILVRPLGENRYQLVAGERRWRASKEAGLDTIPALVEEIDDDTALEIAIIENLQREDLSPLEEATMYDRMVRDHGYSIRKLAEKLGKDKGYLENRLRLADAPEEIRELVSLRKDTLSHAYELLKVKDPKKRRRLAAQVASGELSLVKLRERIEGRPPDPPEVEDGDRAGRDRGRRRRRQRPPRPADDGWTGDRPRRRRTSATTRSSRPATSWPTRSRSWSASCERRTSSPRSRRSTGRTSRST